MTPNEIDQFWMVWEPEHGAPTVRHSSAKAAEAEAERLARKHPGCTFFVVAAYCAFRSVDVGRFELRGPRGLRAGTGAFATEEPPF